MLTLGVAHYCPLGRALTKRRAAGDNQSGLFPSRIPAHRHIGTPLEEPVLDYQPMCVVSCVRPGQLPKWTNGADCKSAGYAFGGSNPPLPTARRRLDDVVGLSGRPSSSVVERNLGKVEVTGSIPVSGSIGPSVTWLVAPAAGWIRWDVYCVQSQAARRRGCRRRRQCA